MKLALGLGFFVTAVLYASVGFGGGSTYTALLVLTQTPFLLIPVISLLCNICVVSGSSYRHLKRGSVRLQKILPLCIFSIPAAYIGGRLHISETLFIGLLAIALFIAGLRLLRAKTPSAETSSLADTPPHILRDLLIGAVIGFYSGIVGIGGGIFLAPILYHFRWGEELGGDGLAIAGAASLFIFVNSCAGLAGHITKFGPDIYTQILPYGPLVVAVLLGGALGNYMSFNYLKPQHLRRLTGGLILLVSLRLAARWISLIQGNGFL